MGKDYGRGTGEIGDVEVMLVGRASWVQSEGRVGPIFPLMKGIEKGSEARCLWGNQWVGKGVEHLLLL